MRKNNKVRIQNILIDFKQKKEPKSFLFNNYFHFSINEEDYEKKRLIRYLFSDFLSFEIWDQHFEKLNWEIPFSFDGVDASITHQKFGFYINISGTVEKNKAIKIKEKIWSKVKLALNLIEPFIQAEGENALKNGEIIIENKLRDIELSYKFFIKRAKAKSKKKNTKESLKKVYTRKREAQYLESAAIIAFFSFLEHLCILTLAFTDGNDKNDIYSFSKLTWQEKFKKVFKIDEEPMQTFYQKFVNLAKYRRNPAAHGYLDKNNTIFDFYLSGAKHRIPMSLYTKKLIENVNNFATFDDMIRFSKELRKNKNTKKIMLYLDNYFDIYYEKNQLSEYQKILQMKEKEFRDYLEYQQRVRDDHGNMDW